MKVRGNDGRVHFSDLKRMSLSPAHYKHACTTPHETTRPMRIGTIAHHLVLGPRPAGARPLACFEGEARRGKAWDLFEAENPDAEIMTRPEWDEAAAIAAAVLADPVAAPFLVGRREKPLQWEDAGIECATSGIDVVGDGWISDLKLAHTAEPARWQRAATTMAYHCQMSFYENGARANGIDTSKGLYIIGVESSPPYPVTVLRMAPSITEMARKQVTLWLERLRLCEESDHWPGYVQSVVDFEAPSWALELAEEEVA